MVQQSIGRNAVAVFLGMALGGAGMSQAHGGVIADTVGDVTPETVRSGWDGSSRDLTPMLSGYVDPATNTLSPITNPSGLPLIVGDVSRGQDPAASDQRQYQRFLVTGTDAAFRLTYLGGNAGYKNIVGFYTYSASTGDNAPITMTPFYTQNVAAPGTGYDFIVGAGNYFGFYVIANGASDPAGTFFTENGRNSDSSNHRTTDHFLTFETNRGLLMAVEDLKYDKSTGLLGDQDYNDLLAGVLTYADGTPFNPSISQAPTPEPASLALLALGGMLLLPRRGSRERA